MHEDNPKKPPYAILVKKKYHQKNKQQANKQKTNKPIENGIEVSLLQTHTHRL